MRDAYAHCEAVVRAGDRDRYLATLFIPAALRPHFFALYAFNLEIASVRERAHAAPAGEIRLQWWADTLEGRATGTAQNAPVAAAFLDTLERHRLPREPFTRLIEARRFDLYDEPMATSTELAGYLRATVSVLFQAAGMMLGADGPGLAQAAEPAGRSYGLTGLLRALPLHAARGQLYLPFDVLERHGVAQAQIASGADTVGLRSALADLRAHAGTLLDEARSALAALAPPARRAFLPLALVDPYLRAMERSDDHPLRARLALPQWRRQWALWRAARRVPFA